MKDKTKKLFLQDCTIIVSMMIVLWAVLFFILTQVKSIALNKTVGGVIFIAGIMVGVFATTAAIAVLVHLRQNRSTLYTRELFFLENKDKIQ